MKRIAIMGLGLMGGSLGLALKARGFDGIVAAYARRPETRTAALAKGVVDEAFENPADAVREADLVIYCTPILTIPSLMESCTRVFKEGALLTDVGSTKDELTARVNAALAGSRAVFVGSHPIAGSEQQGLEAARADLYDGALVVVTPGPDTTDKSQSVQRIADFWSSLGALVRVISAAEHDRLMARTSHLPHMVASLLAATAARSGEDKEMGPYCGTGFRDTTRVASGSPDVWHDIVSTNAAAIRVELEAYRERLDRLIDWMDAKEFETVKDLLEEGRTARCALMAHSPAE